MWWRADGDLLPCNAAWAVVWKDLFVWLHVSQRKHVLTSSNWGEYWGGKIEVTLLHFLCVESTPRLFSMLGNRESTFWDRLSVPPMWITSRMETWLKKMYLYTLNATWYVKCYMKLWKRSVMWYCTVGYLSGPLYLGVRIFIYLFFFCKKLLFFHSDVCC